MPQTLRISKEGTGDQSPLRGLDTQRWTSQLMGPKVSALNAVALAVFIDPPPPPPPPPQSFCQTFSLSARSKRRRAGRKRAGELAPKLKATKPQQDGTPVNQTAKTLAHRIVDPKVEVIRKLASRITDALAADISNVGTNEDEAGA
ncbi:hypothetical protein Pst134EB_003983 [Puccinia striiformis f. sp. tritici]|nr:hypothetical protein Pst134EB_003983 [Puccinia striiformis f. sp. tritici]